MILDPNWAANYVMADTYKNPFSKKDLIYLLMKFAVAKNGAKPMREHLQKLPARMLAGMWARIKPFDFGKPPEDARKS